MATINMLEETANYLLNHCFVLGGVEDQRAKYLYVQDHLDEVRAVFAPLGYSVLLYPAPLQAAALVNGHEGSQARLLKYESILLLVLRLLYLQKRESLAAALALTGEPDAISGALALSLGIGLQNIPEGAAVSLPLAHNGRTRSQAFFAGAASGLVEPLGALLAFALAEWVSTALPWLLSAAAGCMVCVTAQEMIPQAVEGDEPVGVVSIVLGFALMMALDVAL